MGSAVGKTEYAHRGRTFEIDSSCLDLQRRQKRFLRNLHLAQLFHALLAFLLPAQQLALARDVTAIAFGHDVLTEGPYDLARNDAATNGGLDDDLEHLSWDEVFEAVAELAAPVIGFIPMDDGREGICGIAVNKYIELHQVSRTHSFGFVVERGIATRHRLQAVVKVRDDL